MKKWCEKLKGNLFFVSQFALDDFKTKYAGSVLGFFWAFVQPVITVLIYWFIFQIGFKNGDVDGYPFILWLVSGLLPWFFVSDSITNATSSLVEYSYLVKKVLFNINILPVARVVSVFFVQLFLIGFTAILFIVYGQMPSVYWLQLVYYIVYMLLVCIGISYFTASLFVFFRDVVQIVSIVLQIVFWITPIVWQMSIFDEKVQLALNFNPLFYPVRGYRDALMSGKCFWEYGFGWNLYYWLIALAFCLIGMSCFKKLKQHFADVL